MNTTPHVLWEGYGRGRVTVRGWIDSKALVHSNTIVTQRVRVRAHSGAITCHQHQPHKLRILTYTRAAGLVGGSLSHLSSGAGNLVASLSPSLPLSAAPPTASPATLPAPGNAHRGTGPVRPTFSPPPPPMPQPYRPEETAAPVVHVRAGYDVVHGSA